MGPSGQSQRGEWRARPGLRRRLGRGEFGPDRDGLERGELGWRVRMARSERGKGSSRAGPGREWSWAAGFAGPGEEGGKLGSRGKRVGLGFGLFSFFSFLVSLIFSSPNTLKTI